MSELLGRVDNGAGIREVVIATNATTTGEATALYLADALRERAPDVVVTRLASGLRWAPTSSTRTRSRSAERSGVVRRSSALAPPRGARDTRRMALVRGACPHDCPDTCAMHVTVEDGRATKVAGDPDHPITVGFLCGKVSNYLERVYSDERILHPLVREDGDFRRASWEEAIDVAAEGLLRARDEFGGESILPYSYMGTQGLIQGNVMSARVMNALGASNLERTICATAGYAGTSMAHGISPEVDPEEWPNARYLLVWGWNPLSTAPHLWRKLLDARKQGARLVVVDPFRSRTARVADEHLRPLPGTDAALAIGMMRAIVDAGLQDEDWCRAHADGYDELLAELDRTSVEECAATCGVDAEAIARVGREFASTRPALLRLGVGAQRHAGAPAAYSTIASLPALTGAWKDRGGGCSYIPLATAGAISSHPLELRGPA